MKKSKELQELESKLTPAELAAEEEAHYEDRATKWFKNHPHSARYVEGKAKEARVYFELMRKHGCTYLKLDGFEATIDLAPPPRQITLDDLDNIPDPDESAEVKVQRFEKALAEKKQQEAKELEEDLYGA